MDRTKEELRNKHWTEILADRVIEERKEPFVITGGMTTSGPAHLGTVCEFLYPSVVKEVMEKRGCKMPLYFVGDILDAFDSIPVELGKYEAVLKPELGKPLAFTLDPLGCHKSYGEHYLSQAEGLIEKMSLKADVVRATEMYSSGKYDPYAMLFLKDEDKTKEVVARTSLRKIEELKDWSPIMPICEKCGKIATTRVTSHTDTEYEYACDRDVKYTKGCGYAGRARINDHKYKLQWRLHWPSWQAIFGSSIEGSGVDHMTRGGSGDTAYAVHKELLGREPPIFYKYGFVLIHGKKYSKSKGVGLGAAEISRLIPPGVLKYALIEPNIQQNKDIDPNGDRLVNLYNEVEAIEKNDDRKMRYEQKKGMAFNIAIGKLPWKASFVDILLNYQVYRDWNKVGLLLNDRAGVMYLSMYIEEWLSRGYAPERYNFTIKPAKITEMKDIVGKFSSELKEGMTDVEIHDLVYKVAKDSGADPESLFSALYMAIIGKDKGEQYLVLGKPPAFVD